MRGEKHEFVTGGSEVAGSVQLQWPGVRLPMLWHHQDWASWILRGTSHYTEPGVPAPGSWPGIVCHQPGPGNELRLDRKNLFHCSQILHSCSTSNFSHSQTFGYNKDLSVKNECCQLYPFSNFCVFISDVMRAGRGLSVPSVRSTPGVCTGPAPPPGIRGIRKKDRKRNKTGTQKSYS